MAKFGFNDILNAKSKAAGAGAVTDYTEIWLNPHDVKPSENNFFSHGVSSLLYAFPIISDKSSMAAVISL